MIKTKEKRETEERQRTEELDTFAGQLIRQSLSGAQLQQLTSSSSSQTQLPLLQEEEDNN